MSLQGFLGSALALPLALAASAGAGVLVNEGSHGGLSEAAGLGHHHMFDVGGVHCAAHDAGALGAMHMAHMHGSGSPDWPHGQCPGGPGMHRSGAMGGTHGNGTMEGRHGAATWGSSPDGEVADGA